MRKGRLMRFPALLLAAALSLAPGGATPAGAAADDIRVIVAGRTLAPDVPPRIVAGRVLVPMRAIFEALGASVTWDPVVRAVEARRGDVAVQLVVRASVARVNGHPTRLDVPAQVVAGRTLVPIRFVSESLGAGVSWNEATRTVAVTPDAGTPPPPAAPGGPPALRLEAAATGLQRPVLITHAGDGSRRLFVLEQAGRIRIIQDGGLLPEPFLDLTRLIPSSSGERGLLGLAFHPRFRENGRFFVNYTGARGATYVARYRVASTDPNRADPASGAVILTVEQPYANHNGGHLAFGPDGYLYVALGDGGSGGDPHGHGQNAGTLLGSLLRLKVDGTATYTTPPDNPFAGRSGRDEIWAWGLRNPWRFSFDRETGDLYIADVGQGRVEEVNFQLAGAAGGQNYGWNVWEGTRRYRNGTAPGAVFPVAEYEHGPDGCSVTGGYVYRGQAHLELSGTYLFGDYCSGRIWGLTRSGGRWRVDLLLDTNLNIASFGEDEAGELYVVDHRGAIYRVRVR